MEVIWAHKAASVHQVVTDLTSTTAYTTVKTVMERLEKKGYLKRRKTGRAYVYTAALTRESLERQASRGVIDGLLDSFGSSAMVQFAEAIRERPQRLAELRHLLKHLFDDGLQGGSP